MRIEARRAVAATPQAVWDVVSDPCVLGALTDTLLVQELEPGTKAGVGARYRALLRVGPVPVGGNVEIIEFEPPSNLAWTTLTGVDHRLRLRLRPHPEGGTWLTLRFAYAPRAMVFSGHRRKLLGGPVFSSHHALLGEPVFSGCPHQPCVYARLLRPANASSPAIASSTAGHRVTP